MKITLKPYQKVFVTSDTHYSHKNICRGISEWNPKLKPEIGSAKSRPMKAFLKSTRDFKNLNHMNQSIVKNINEVVGENDILIHLGDWSFGGIEQIWEFRKQIICKNIYLIFGNHDEYIIDNKILPNCHIGYDGYDEVIRDGENPLTYGDPRDDMFNVSAQDLFTWTGHYTEFEIVYPQLDRNVKTRRFKFIAFHYPIISWNGMGKGKIHLYGHIHSSPARLKYKSMDVGIDGNNFKPYNINDIDKIMSKQDIGHLINNDHHQPKFS